MNEQRKRILLMVESALDRGWFATARYLLEVAYTAIGRES